MQRPTSLFLQVGLNDFTLKKVCEETSVDFRNLKKYKK